MKMHDTAIYSTFVLPQIKVHAMHDTPQVRFVQLSKDQSYFTANFLNTYTNVQIKQAS